MMTTDRGCYRAYLLRLWQVRTDGETVWRASLENPHTGERHGFAGLDRLFEFLEQQTSSATANENQPLVASNQ
jgi:hypothetical protein